MPSAPDLENGVIVNQSEGDNQWTTEIQCVLRTGDIPPRLVYLSHECRAEFVPLSSNHPGPGRFLFQQDRPWEFLTYSEDGRFFQTNTASLAMMNPEGMRDVQTKTPRLSIRNQGNTNPDVIDEVPLTRAIPSPEERSEVICPERPVAFLGIDEVGDRLRQRTLPVRKLFMEVRWTEADVGHTLYCPCRYVNFSAPDASGPAFLQPISGPVLFTERGLILVAYVACAIDANGHTIAEFCIRRIRNVFSWAVQSVEFNPADLDVLRTLALRLPVATTVYDGVVPVEATVRFYRYP